MFEYLIRHKTKIQHLHKPKNIFTSNNGGSGTGGSGTGGSTTGTPINFDATSSSSQIGALVASTNSTAGEASMTAGTYDGVTLSGTVSRPKDTSGSNPCVQLKKNDAQAVFTVTSGAVITIIASSSGSGKSTYYTLSGAVSGNATVSESSSFTTKVFTATSDGTVTLAPTQYQADGATNNNNLRIQKITVTYN